MEADWIFGFGSLISNPGFDHSDVVRPCYIKGWRRVFWQGSTDHRGVPGAPGRTVTLEPCDGAVTWGAAFKLSGDEQQRRETLKYLEWREKQYDLRAQVAVFTPDSHHMPVLTALTFVATADVSRNPNYLGPAPLAEMAQQIATARGPSGPNFEYLFRLADAMRGMSVQDEELFELEAEVLACMQCLGTGIAAMPSTAALPRQHDSASHVGGSSAEEQQQQSDATEVSVCSSSLAR